MANKFKSYMTTLTGTSETTLITASDTSVFIIGSIVICNTGGTASTISMVITDTSAGTDVNVLLDESFATKESQEILSRPIIIENLDVLKAQAADANFFDIIISYIDRDRT
jgi:hypothetical protein